MVDLSPTGARILDSNDNGAVAGHPAAIARLQADGLVVPNQNADAHQMTAAGWAALHAWRAAGSDLTAPAPLTLPKLAAKPHEAVITAAQRPDQLVPGRDDDAYWAGQPWFNARTLAAVYRAGYANIRPQPWDRGPVTWHDTGRSLFLTPAGRDYARQHAGIEVHRRRVVIVACGSKKARPDYETYGYRDVIPAGHLYIGSYHRSLRLAADALTDQSLIRIMSALHGLVTLNRPLSPYDTRLGDPRSVTPGRLAQHAAALGLDDADVIFLGGSDYSALFVQAVPHALTPLYGSPRSHRSQCRLIHENPTLVQEWWDAAVELHERRPHRPEGMSRPEGQESPPSFRPVPATHQTAHTNRQTRR